ncbi:MAG: hypothetical protein U0228_38140 [Myxococcaceae bacterium]
MRPTAALIATGVWGPGLFISGFFAMFSVMLFDAPGSENNPYLLFAASGLWSAPVLCIVSILASWLAWGLSRTKPPEAQGPWRAVRVIAACLPLLSVVVTVVGFVLLQVKCGGSTRC